MIEERAKLHMHEIDAYTKEGVLFRRLDGNRLECFACGHRCRIGSGRRGICKVRFHDGETLRVPTGYFSAVNADPIEKKPFYHVLPGTRAMSFGMLGCDYHCDYCQNWITSQTLRDPDARSILEAADPAAFIDAAIASQCFVVTSTYNEPLITSEWAMEIFRLARMRGLLTSYVSNGNGTPEVIEYLAPWIDMYKVDLKGFREATYREFGGVLNTVLDTIILLHRKGIWVEIVTLIVPGLNDSESELRDIASFIAGISADIPWHVTAFHPDYRMTETEPTGVRSLTGAVDIGHEYGLRYVYAGNIGSRAGRASHTWCPRCGTLLIERTGYVIGKNAILDGKCSGCGTSIAGIWSRPRTTGG